jgi:hypothetical protein
VGGGYLMQSYIIKNSAQCNVCKEVLVSKHRHDFISCSCYRKSNGAVGIFIDGGTSYLRRGGNPNNIIELSEHTPEE